MAKRTSIVLGAALALALAQLTAPAAADEAEDQLRRASPGSCAEPRRFEAGVACTDCPSVTAAERDGFSVAGPARGRFSPKDVAATVTDVPLSAPERGDFEGRGPCDTPGSCGATTGPLLPPGGNGSPGGAGGGVSVVERPPKPTGPPGSNPPR